MNIFGGHARVARGTDLSHLRLDRDGEEQYAFLRERAARALALEAAMYAHTDRLAELAGLPAIDWDAAKTAELGARVGLRVVPT